MFNEFSTTDLEIMGRCAAGNVYAGMDYKAESGIFKNEEEQSESVYAELANPEGNKDLQKSFFEEMKKYGYNEFKFELVKPYHYEIVMA